MQSTDTEMTISPPGCTITVCGSHDAWKQAIAIAQSIAAEPGSAGELLWGNNFTYQNAEDAEFHAGLKMSLRNAGLLQNLHQATEELFVDFISKATNIVQAQSNDPSVSITWTLKADDLDTTVHLPESVTWNFSDPGKAQKMYRLLTTADSQLTSPEQTLKQSAKQKLLDDIQKTSSQAVVGTAPLHLILKAPKTRMIYTNVKK